MEPLENGRKENTFWNDCSIIEEDEYEINKSKKRKKEKIKKKWKLWKGEERKKGKKSKGEEKESEKMPRKGCDRKTGQ